MPSLSVPLRPPGRPLADGTVWRRYRGRGVSLGSHACHTLVTHTACLIRALCHSSRPSLGARLRRYGECDESVVRDAVVKGRVRDAYHSHPHYAPSLSSRVSFAFLTSHFPSLRLFLVTFSPRTAPFRTRRDDRREARRERNGRAVEGTGNCVSRHDVPRSLVVPTRLSPLMSVPPVPLRPLSLRAWREPYMRRRVKDVRK